MIAGHQSSRAKNVAGIDLLMALIAIPAEFHRPLEQAKHAVARFPRGKDQRPFFKGDHLTGAGEGTHGVEGIHQQRGELQKSLTSGPNQGQGAGKPKAAPRPACTSAGISLPS